MEIMRRRNMYNLTGQPGWMRLGYSPGWAGRSPSGLGPCATYLMSGQWPAAQTSAPFSPFAAAPGITPDARLDLLKNQAGMLEQQLTALKSQIVALEGADA
jgi:hypothetical protein